VGTSSAPLPEPSQVAPLAKPIPPNYSPTFPTPRLQRPRISFCRRLSAGRYWHGGGCHWRQGNSGPIFAERQNLYVRLIPFLGISPIPSKHRKTI